MAIRIEIDIIDAMPRSGCNIGYQARPGEHATEEEISTSNVIIAFCSLLSDPDFVDYIAPHIEKELQQLEKYQKAAMVGSKQVM